ncbi:Clavaminate synthase-like protein [Violaceomyces palustris]|uniref:Clavaminate synthase-like protein n=1 Tax=Violaceomyces palustris TaxID=1673888 RepID=A0ACD0NPJ4_9BASI|nr:Clavaminate synthase-like protein [Violaceomyces palustris]
MTTKLGGRILSSSKALPLIPCPKRSIGPRDFVEEYQLPSRPGLFQGLVRGKEGEQGTSWPALRKWSKLVRGVETLGGMRNPESERLMVPVEVSRPGRGYMESSSPSNEEGFVRSKRKGSDQGWQRLEMPFGIFLDAFIQREIAWSSSPSSSPPLIGYMAQFDLLSSCESLSKDAPSLPHSKAGPRSDREQWRSNVWIGPEDTFTPIHSDPYENLLVQVVGSKRVHLFPPEAGHLIYLDRGGGGASSLQPNTSIVPTEDPLLLLPPQPSSSSPLDPFPDLQEALALQGSRHAILHPGDVLFIPRGWYHCVRSLSTSVSVNWWFR